MRRFSQRSSLVTLSEINITPLLDLAFVLLIIFVITTPLLEQGLNLKLPTGGIVDPPKLDPKNIRTVEVNASGSYWLHDRWLNLNDAAAALAYAHRRNPQLLIYIRADENVVYKHVIALINRLQLAGIDDVSLRTEPPAR